MSTDVKLYYRENAEGKMEPIPDDELDVRCQRGMTITLDDAGRRHIEIDGKPLPLFTADQPVRVDYVAHTGPGVRGDQTGAYVWVPLFVHQHLDIDPEVIAAGKVVITTPPKPFNWDDV